MTAPHWTHALHHDGSALYVSNPAPHLGEIITLTLRAPANAPIVQAYLRTTPDGEQHFTPLERQAGAGEWAYWTATLPITMPLTSYRFRLLTADSGYWYNGAGAHQADHLDLFDFKLLADFAAPEWLRRAVFYQIFPDRFHNGDPANDVPDGAWQQDGCTTQRRPWGTEPLKWQAGGCLDFFGGDLQGITQKLDYITDLGATALYLTPIFTAYTNHRYDIADYSHIDPYVGGEAGLAELRQALDERHMHLILDITPNHCGVRNVWFTAAQADAASPTADYFTFTEHPHHYATWLNVQTLVKLNYGSQKLRDALYRAADAPFRTWLRPPYRIDGWSLDVGNMTGRQGALQLSSQIWRELRSVVKSENPHAYLMAENFYDGTPHLQGDELDATMNYRGFSYPLWNWLHQPPEATEVRANPFFEPQAWGAEVVAEQWRTFRAAVPWAIVQQQFNLLGSHDTPRALWFFNGDKARLKLALVILMTYPGVPCVYYGDEIGLTGGEDPDNRRCMPWDSAQWDTDLRAHYQRWLRLRSTTPALTDGGYEDVYAAGDWLAYTRTAPSQRWLIVAQRGGTATPLQLPLHHAGYSGGQTLRDVLTGETFTVADTGITLDGQAQAHFWVLEG